jgi:membrane protein YqaA with SNARE-associated domain
MVIWSGIGILIIFLPVIFSLAVVPTINSILGDGYCLTHHWTLGPSLVLSAIACWFLGKFLNSQFRTVIDKKTGREIQLRQRQSLFFIPMQWWSIVFAGFAIAAFFVKE